MLRITRILAPTDLSELSKDGVHAALDLARSHGATVTIYNVLEFERAHSSSPELEHIRSPSSWNVKRFWLNSSTKI
jgi:nucleotide-binding universal stress UspA family protein